MPLVVRLLIDSNYTWVVHLQHCSGHMLCIRHSMSWAVSWLDPKIYVARQLEPMPVHYAGIHCKALALWLFKYVVWDGQATHNKD
jgi:hypothetical protein